MINVRRATVEDAAELVRLRGVLFGIPEASDEGGWREASRRILTRRLAEPSPTMAGFVVDQSLIAGLPADSGVDQSTATGSPTAQAADPPTAARSPTAQAADPPTAARSPAGSDADRLVAVGSLAACAVGIIEERLGGPGNPRGLVGYVFNVATDPAHRRLGYARACTAALLEWFAAEGVHTVDLRATPTAEPLYASQGFVRTADPAMRLTRRHN